MDSPYYEGENAPNRHTLPLSKTSSMKDELYLVELEGQSDPIEPPKHHRLILRLLLRKAFTYVIKHGKKFKLVPN